MTSARDFCRAVNPNFERKDPSTMWFDPKYPGDTVRIQRLQCKRTGELGDVRIQSYGTGIYRIASFCPGRTLELPGDSPKTEPEANKWCETVGTADAWFDLFIAEQEKLGWKKLTTTVETTCDPAGGGAP